MTRYAVKMTPYAVRQLQESVAYISKVLLAPEAARGWADRLENEIAALEFFPERNPLVDPEPWRTRGIRKKPVHNFMIYYSVDGANRTVWVTAIVYAKRNQLESLKQIPPAKKT